MKALSLFLLIVFTLSIFTAGAGPAFARETTSRRAVITAMEGSVLVQASGQAVAVPARKNMEIKSGDRIITGKDGTCEIRYDDGSISRIGPGSRVDISALSRQGADGAETTVLSVNRGSVWNNTKEVVQRNSRFEVNTPSAVAGVRGTQFYINVMSFLDTILRVYSGLVGMAPSPEERPEEEDVPPPPPPPGQEIPVNPFQQLLFTAQAPPPAPAPLDALAVDDFEKDNLVEDFPAAYVEIETEVKTFQLQQAEARVLGELTNLARITQELELLKQQLARETDPAKIAQLQSLQQLLQSEMGSRLEVAKNVEKERQALAQEKQKLAELKEKLDELTPEQLKEQAQAVRQEDKARAEERQERQEQIIQQEKTATETRQQVTRQAEASGVKEILQQAAALVTPELIQRLSQEVLPPPPPAVPPLLPTLPTTPLSPPTVEDYSLPPSLSTISASQLQDITIAVGASGSVVISFSPPDVSVSAVSSNTNVATVTVEDLGSDKRFTVTGISAGVVNITVTASRTGYLTEIRSFPVTVIPAPLVVTHEPIFVGYTTPAAIYIENNIVSQYPAAGSSLWSTGDIGNLSLDQIKKIDAHGMPTIETGVNLVDTNFSESGIDCVLPVGLGEGGYVIHVRKNSKIIGAALFWVVTYPPPPSPFSEALTGNQIMIYNYVTGNDKMLIQNIPNISVIKVYSSETGQTLLAQNSSYEGVCWVTIEGGFNSELTEVYVTITESEKAESPRTQKLIPLPPIMQINIDYTAQTETGKIIYKMTQYQKDAIELATVKTIYKVVAFTAGYGCTFTVLPAIEEGIVVPIGDTGAIKDIPAGNYGYAIAAYDNQNNVIAYYISIEWLTV